MAARQSKTENLSTNPLEDTHEQAEANPTEYSTSGSYEVHPKS
ncbi:hypothetical protein [Nostoc sp. LEGE 12450]|nr:hypothetical protein [Nostoc sp. LEGE 12450]